MTNPGWLVLLLNLLEDGDAGQKAAAIALQYGTIDGAFHKMWVIDQMVRVIAGDEYDKWMQVYKEAGYEWEVGVAP